MSEKSPMTPIDMDRLRGDAPPETHLARYERAHFAGARRVIHVACPDCGAPSLQLYRRGTE